MMRTFVSFWYNLSCNIPFSHTKGKYSYSSKKKYTYNCKVFISTKRYLNFITITTYRQLYIAAQNTTTFTFAEKIGIR